MSNAYWTKAVDKGISLVENGTSLIIFLKTLFYTSTNLSNRMITTHSLGEGSLLVMKLVLNKNMFKINKFFLLCTCTQHIGI